MIQVGRLCGHVNNDRRALVAEGDLSLIPTVARRSGGIASGGRACGASSSRGARTRRICFT